jgi:hypothetical protein
MEEGTKKPFMPGRGWGAAFLLTGVVLGCVATWQFWKGGIGGTRFAVDGVLAVVATAFGIEILVRKRPQS